MRQLVRQGKDGDSMAARCVIDVISDGLMLIRCNLRPSNGA